MTRARLAERAAAGAGARSRGAPRRRTTRGGAAITILYVRPDGAGPSELEARVAEVARRYGPAVALEVRSYGDAGRLARWARPGSPAVLVLRRGVVVGEAMGEGLPVR